MGDLHWTSGITQVSPNRLLVRGYPIDALMESASFGQMVYLLLKGELPGYRESRMMEAILVSSVDHGATPPSILSALTTATTGAALNACVASGVLSISQHHGGAIEECMKLLSETVVLVDSGRSPVLDTAANSLIVRYLNEGRRLPGFGHRLHTDDPRTRRLFHMAETLGIAGRHVKAARAIAQEYEAIKHKPLPVNVDGAIAAVLADMEFPPECANGIFMISRLPGIVAHVLEEQQRQKPMRRIDPVDHTYDGPAERGVPAATSMFREEK